MTQFLKKTLLGITCFFLTATTANATKDIPSFEEISNAHAIIKEQIPETPCLFSWSLSKITGANVYLKCENLQTTGSFKDRGAAYKLHSLTDKEKKQGVITASTGNHAQGVSYNAKRFKIPATIVMPTNTPYIKIKRTKDLDAKIILKGNSFEDAMKHATQLAKDKDLTFIHAYNDNEIITGQGTAALEMLLTYPQIDTLIVPVGGGGLIAGSTVAAKAIKPYIAIYGVEATNYSSMKQKLSHEAVNTGGITLAEGMAIKTTGDKPMQVIKDKVEDILVVDEHYIEQAIALLVSKAKIVAEGAGATPLAAMLQYPEIFKDKNVGLIISGGNIDPYELAIILLRSMTKNGQLVRIAIPVIDHPDHIGMISSIIDKAGAIIREVHNNTVFGVTPLTYPEMIFMVETHDWKHAHKVVEALKQKDVEARLIQ